MTNLKSDGIKKAEAVEPIKNKKDLKKLITYLKATNIRNFAIFEIGSNTLLRAGDLLQFRWRDVMDHDGEYKKKFTITEQKTDKSREVRLNKNVIDALEALRKSLTSFDRDDYIFPSRKKGSHLQVKSLHKIIKETCKELNIKGNYGTHTMRKTGAYHIYVSNVAENPMIISYLQKILNHSSQAITLRYIGIEAEEIDDIFDNLKMY